MEEEEADTPVRVTSLLLHKVTGDTVDRRLSNSNGADHLQWNSSGEDLHLHNREDGALLLLK